MSDKEKPRIGRPPEPVPQDVADAILEWLVSGRTLTSFCEIAGNPRLSTVSDWTAKDPEFAGRFARAREIMATREIEETREIADDAEPEDVQVAKLRIETRLKRAACFCPRLYGTKVALGGDASAPPIQVKATGPAPPSTTDLLAGIAKLSELAKEHLGDDGDDDAE